MRKVTTGAMKAKTATHAPKMEAPEAAREIAANGVADTVAKVAAGTEEAYEKVEVAAEQTTDHLKTSLTTIAKGATDYNLKVLEIARINATTAFDYVHGLLGVKSLPEFVELSTAHTRQRVEAMISQTRELTELAVKLTMQSAP
jgi:phasin